MSHNPKKIQHISTFEGYDAWSEEYDQFNNPLISLADFALQNHPLLVEDKVILELGCGTGRNIRHIQKGGYKKYIGIDGSKLMLSKARNAYSAKTEFILADLSGPLPIEDGVIDIILISLVLEHLKDLNQILKECSRVLKKGGQLRILEIHEDLTSKGVGAHFEKDGVTFVLPSYIHSQEEFRISLSENQFNDYSFTNLSPTKSMIEKMPKLSKHEGKAMLLDIVAYEGEKV